MSFRVLPPFPPMNTCVVSYCATVEPRSRLTVLHKNAFQGQETRPRRRGARALQSLVARVPETIRRRSGYPPGGKIDQRIGSPRRCEFKAMVLCSLFAEQVAAGLHAGSEAVGGNPGSQSGSQRRRRRFGRGGRGGGDDGEDGFGADKTKRKPSTRDPKGEARSAAGVIENVAILGAPIGASPARWQRISRIVHGRLINGYSKSDMILGLVFRAKSLSFSIAGVQKVHPDWELCLSELIRYGSAR